MPLRVNIPPLTRSLLVLLLSLSLLNSSLRYRSWNHEVKWTSIHIPYLAIVPGQSLIYPWVIFTSALVEQNVVSFIASVLTIFYGGRYLERAWGASEFAKFVLFVTMIPNMITFAVYCLWFALTGNEVRVYVIPDIRIMPTVAHSADEIQATPSSTASSPSKPPFLSPSSSWSPNTPFLCLGGRSACASSISLPSLSC